ncbi:MAG TPA: MBOAT family O-acyltransferase [Candidatus Pacearchaeota archaeon]|nr:MBOAT family protein [Candidatus Parcubacteria bacterium]HNP79263.1 MBOAT family O-acyltransferase [Candidatus Pacearchaeota archaeon]HOC53518.1 MBOAT family O-acyltransferase [Candidatus Pacearchaeota archaeon]HQM24408.1 MBOAT family O-acyltransferase [Candidatus Pacearchaeota archaeon]
MIFPTIEFFLFFTIVLTLNWAFKPWPLIWRFFLLLSSYYFYALWDERFLLLLISVTLVNFLGALVIEKVNYFKKFYLFLFILINLFCLSFFKYYDFFRTGAESVLEKFGIFYTFPLFDIILPLGLSFYVFRAISYIADVYSKKIPATKSLLDFSIYVSFFPQLFSGPISRAIDFLPQLKNGGAKKIDDFHKNLTLIILGLFKKIVISSYLILNITDDVFAVPENHSALVVWLALLSYYLVIYFDFSGYSDMAIGFAGLLGFESPINFNTPYLATSIKDFWRRWHITLSSWIKDYVYIPLGGNRHGLIVKYLNLTIIMILIGLWHGASMNYIIWGGIQGIGLVIFNLRHDIEKKLFPNKKEHGIRDIFGKISGWIFTFAFILFSWVFFKARTSEIAITYLKSLFDFNRPIESFQLLIPIYIIIGFFLVFFEKQIINIMVRIKEKMPWPILGIYIATLLVLVFKLSQDIMPPFIYFDF